MSRFTVKNWYIWLSIPAFMFLSFTTSVLLMFPKTFLKTKEDVYHLYLKSMGKMLGYWLLMIIIFFATSLVISILLPDLIGLPIFAIIIYSSGVFMTYRFDNWRKEALSRFFESRKEKE